MHSPTLPTMLDVAGLARLLDQHTPIKVIDVRTPAEFETAHITGSYNVPLDQLGEHRSELRDRLRAPAILVCRTDRRAQEAGQVLSAAGLEQIHILQGGITAWEAAGQPLNLGHQRWSLERQVRGVAGALVVLGMLGGRFVWRPVGYLATMIGAGLAYSAATDSCAMGMLLAKLPYNQGATCDVQAVVAHLTTE
ncbi:MAG: rhodanese-like domain-containing protein [Herpetosiphon sp.]